MNMSTANRGRPRKPVERVHVTLSATITPQHMQWLQDAAMRQSIRLGTDISVSSIVRACIRQAEADRKNGLFPDENWQMA